MADMASITAEPPAREMYPLTGTWHNQLGSELVLEADDFGGLKGHYTSGAGVVAGTRYPLVGTYDPGPHAGVTLLGFVLDWTDVHAVTVWSGQYHHAGGMIRATWIMATETDEGAEWKSTFVGHDVFGRDDAVAKAPGGVSFIP
jgi:hypothetical protein